MVDRLIADRIGPLIQRNAVSRSRTSTRLLANHGCPRSRDRPYDADHTKQMALAEIDRLLCQLSPLAALIARRIGPHAASAQPGQPLARGCGRGGDSGLRPRGGNRARQRRLGAWSPLIRWAGRLASGCDAGTSVRTTSSGCTRVRPLGHWLRGQSGSRQLDASGSLVSRCTGRLGATWLPLRMHSLSGVERVGLERAAHPRGQGN